MPPATPVRGLAALLAILASLTLVPRKGDSVSRLLEAKRAGGTPARLRRQRPRFEGHFRGLKQSKYRVVAR